MTLNLGSPWLSCLSYPSSSTPYLSKLPETSPKSNYALLSLLLSSSTTIGFKNAAFSASRTLKSRASLSSKSESGLVEDNHAISISELLSNEESLGRVLATKEADEALEIIAEISNASSGVISVPDSCFIITAALDRNNADLALSVFYAMRSSFDPCKPNALTLLIEIVLTVVIILVGGSENGPLIERWKWSRPDVSVYTSLIRGLAALLKVSDALRMIDYICRVGVSPSEEVMLIFVFYGHKFIKIQDFIFYCPGSFWESGEMSNLYDSCCCCTTPTWHSGINCNSV